MNIEQEDLWLCSDCAIAAVTDDYTGLDHHYREPEVTQRATNIREGLAALGPHLVPGDSDLMMSFSRCLCDCCHTRSGGERHPFLILGE